MTDNSIDLKEHARLLTPDIKKSHVLSFPEVELFPHLKILLQRMQKGALAEITHGVDEFGRDLVLKRPDPVGDYFVGIVVKKGDASGKITAKSASVIDDIISQAKQAIAHPCYLKEIEVGAVKISQVWIIFIGTLTANATKRVEYELKDSSMRTFSLGWLIKNLEECYPEFYFDAPLATFIQEQISNLETYGELPRKFTSLSRDYIDPWVAKYELYYDIETKMAKSLNREKFSFNKLEEIIKPGCKILLVGDPGTGKSASLAKIGLDIFRKSLHTMSELKNEVGKTIEVPILIKATDFILHDTCESLINVLFPETSLREKLKVQLLLLDGLDELKAGNRSKAMERAEEFCKDTGCGLVISSRKVDALIQDTSPFTQYELLPFEYEQAVRLIQRLVDDQDVVNIIKDGLQKQELKISLTPLSLQLLAEVAQAEREIPASIAEIFDQYTDLALGRHDTVKGIESIFEYIVKKNFLAELAWSEFRQKDRLFISREDFEAFTTAYMSEYRWEKEQFEQFITEIERAGILRIGELVFFKHRSFLDYFTALRISLHREEISNVNKIVADTYFKDIWSEVAFFYVGILRRISHEIIHLITIFDTPSLRTMLLKILIGRLLQAGWNTPSRIKKQAMALAISNIQPVHDHLIEVFESRELKAPTIISDLFVLGLLEYSFGSRTLRKENAEMATELLEKGDTVSLFNCLGFLWANRHHMSEAELRQYGPDIMKVLTKLESDHALPTHDKYVCLFVLGQLEKEDPILQKSIRRKLDHISKQHPAEMRKLLPPPRKGFRHK